MDPAACWRRACDALNDGDCTMAIVALGDLLEWIEKGGFMPDSIPLNREGLRLVRKGLVRT